MSLIYQNVYIIIIYFFFGYYILTVLKILFTVIPIFFTHFVIKILDENIM